MATRTHGTDLDRKMYKLKVKSLKTSSKKSGTAQSVSASNGSDKGKSNDINSMPYTRYGMRSYMLMFGYLTSS